MESQSHVYDVGEVDFAQKVLEASKDGLILVDFWATWCEPCRALAPVLERLASEANGTLRVAKVDTEQEPRLAQVFRVQSIPFVVAIKDGKPVDAFAGALPEHELRSFCEEHGAVFGGPGPIQDAEIVNAPLPLAIEALKRQQLDGFVAVLPELEAIEEDEDAFTDAERLLQAVPFFKGEIAGDGPAADALRQAHAAWREGALARCFDHLLESLSESASFADELARRAMVGLFVVHRDQDDLVSQTRRRMALLLH